MLYIMDYIKLHIACAIYNEQTTTMKLVDISPTQPITVILGVNLAMTILNVSVRVFILR